MHRPSACTNLYWRCAETAFLWRVNSKRNCGEKDMEDAGGESSIPFILSHLYPQVSTLKKAVQELTGTSCGSFLSSSDPPGYLDSCNRALVACERENQLQQLSCGVRRGLYQYETRQRTSGRRNTVLALESILTAAKRVSTSLVGCTVVFI